MLVNNDLQDQWIPRYFKLAIANLLSNLMVPLSGMVTVSFLGHLQDIRYLAGVALGTAVFNYLYRAFNFLRTSVTGTTAQATGRNDPQEVLLLGLRNLLIALVLRRLKVVDSGANKTSIILSAIPVNEIDNQ